MAPFFYICSLLVFLQFPPAKTKIHDGSCTLIQILSSLLLQVSWSSVSSCPPCWILVNSGRRTATMDGLSVWSTGSASAATPITMDLSATSSAGPVMTSLVTSAVTSVVPRSAWRAGWEQSAKRVREHLNVPHVRIYTKEYHIKCPVYIWKKKNHKNN